jgi:hypothetical protein
VTCPASSKCAWHTDFKVVGCCHTTSSGECFFYTGCADASSKNTLGDGDDEYSYTW